MPDGALKATEHQFRSLLDAAAGGIEVRLSLFALQDVPRSAAGRHHIDSHYASIDALWTSRLDGLIVTGAEPRAANLADEPYWTTLTQVFDWAEQNVATTICSCLAAHAAVQHLDGICRRRFADKRFGVFECAKASDHALMSGVPGLLLAPHSRWNDLAEGELIAAGYSVLTCAADGVDAFVKQRKSLFLFFQGHPEYEADTLLLEYRRDVGRFLRGERDTHPNMPEGYFDRETEAILSKLRDRALLQPSEDLLAHFPTALAAEQLANTWRPMASAIYANWLDYQLRLKEHSLPHMSVRNQRPLPQPSASL
jgi:homoserine O-succinyltransferase